MISTPSPGAVQLSVTDQGGGISPEHRARIFERFYRAHSNRHLTGIGLGLYITRELARANDGDVTYRSGEPTGSVFTLTVPRVDAEEVDAPAGTLPPYDALGLQMRLHNLTPPLVVAERGVARAARARGLRGLSRNRSRGAPAAEATRTGSGWQRGGRAESPPIDAAEKGARHLLPGRFFS